MMEEEKKPVKKIKINDAGKSADNDSVESEPEQPAAEPEEKESAEETVAEAEPDIESVTQEAKENYDRFLRVSAEFENYKKRSAREMENFRKFANESLLRELLPVIDNLERAIESSADNEGANHGIVEGIHMTHQEILKVLEKFHVKPIDALGKPFDPGYHQAVMQEETEPTSEKPEQTVLTEFQKGYMIHDRLLRPSMVVVSKPKETRGESGGGNEGALPDHSDSEAN